MKMRFALLVACAGTFVVVHAPMALASNDPIPGVDIVVKKHPGGNAITVGDCQSGGGKVVKIGGQWACTGLPSGGKSGKALPKTGNGKAGAAINTTRLNIKHPN